MSSTKTRKPRAKNNTVTESTVPEVVPHADAVAVADVAPVKVTKVSKVKASADSEKKANVEEKKPRVKKEKKPIQVVAIVTSEGIEGSFTPEPRRPLIVHLPFNSSEVNFNETLQYDPNPPPQVQPYDADHSYFQVNSEKCSEENQIGVDLDGWKMSLEEQLKKPMFEGLGLVKVEKKEVEKKETTYLQEKVEKQQLLSCYSVKTGDLFVPPTKTDIQCFWCTHPFEGIPYFLPVKEENKTYHVYGNYCSPQCGLSFLLNEHLDSHVRWERMSLLHRMYKSVGRLYPAPPREALKVYGGIYSIEEFRDIISNNRIRVDIQVPPMVSILGTLDTKPIDFYDSSLQNTFTQGFSMDRFKAWSEQGGALKSLRLQRSKPLKDRESTLDACIQINVIRGEVKN
jgi:hypothetical protein